MWSAAVRPYVDIARAAVLDGHDGGRERCIAFFKTGIVIKAPVDVIIFDLFGVIISFNDDLVTQRLADHCLNPQEAYLAMRGIVSTNALICGKLTLSDLHANLVSRHGLSLSFSEFNQSWIIPYSKPMPGMRDLLEELAADHTLVLLSNVDKYYWQTIQDNHEELRYFSHLILSWEVGEAKPDKEIFRRAVRVVGADASRCFLIDDKRENVDAAIGLGIQGHHFTGVGKLREALNMSAQ